MIFSCNYSCYETITGLIFYINKFASKLPRNGELYWKFPKEGIVYHKEPFFIRVRYVLCYGWKNIIAIRRRNPTVGADTSPICGISFGLRPSPAKTHLVYDMICDGGTYSVGELVFMFQCANSAPNIFIDNSHKVHSINKLVGLSTAYIMLRFRHSMIPH